MRQVIEGQAMYVVEFKTMPELPITGLIDIEKTEQELLSVARGYVSHIFDPGYRYDGLYAQALTNAIETGVITEPGKYGIHLVPGTNRYEIYKIAE